MTETATDQQRIEAAAGSVAAKLQTLHAGLTPDEQQVLALALHHSGADADETMDDVAGYLFPMVDAGIGMRRADVRDRVNQVVMVMEGLGIPWTPPTLP